MRSTFRSRRRWSIFWSIFRRSSDLTMLFISHDLRVVRQISDRVAVMYLGRIVEPGHADDLFVSPQHPYTRALVSASPAPGRRSSATGSCFRGDPPNPAARPSGCAFHPRCPSAFARCRAEAPALVEVAAGDRQCRLPSDRTGIAGDCGAGSALPDGALFRDPHRPRR